MAKKIPNHPEHPLPSPSSGRGGDAETDVLYPDDQLVIDGQSVTLHEYTFAEGLKATAIARPLLARLTVLVNDQDEINIKINDLLTISQDYPDEWIGLLALATGLEVETIAHLSDADGSLLSARAWQVLLPFFGRRLAVERVLDNIGPASPTSLPH